MGLFDSKRPKSALMRDRAYKSNEPHEQAYVRKTRPKNPRYMADGGGVGKGLNVGDNVRFTKEFYDYQSGSGHNRYGDTDYGVLKIREIDDEQKDSNGDFYLTLSNGMTMPKEWLQKTSDKIGGSKDIKTNIGNNGIYADGGMVDLSKYVDRIGSIEYGVLEPNGHQVVHHLNQAMGSDDREEMIDHLAQARGYMPISINKYSYLALQINDIINDLDEEYADGGMAESIKNKVKKLTGDDLDTYKFFIREGDTEERAWQGVLDGRKDRKKHKSNEDFYRRAYEMKDGGSIEENKRMAVETFLGGLTNDELYYVANEYADLDWDDDANLDNQIQMWIKSLSNQDINMLHEELLGYKRGGKVDGRSTRAKNTWNSGGAWTRDRNAHNKSEDWEKPMNKRGGSSKTKTTMKAPSKSSTTSKSGKSKYSYIPNAMLREAEVENKGKTTYIDGADILDGIYVKKGTKYADGGGVGGEYNGIDLYDNVYIPSLNKSGMVTNIFTENGKRMVGIELLNGKGIKIEATKVKKKLAYAEGGIIVGDTVTVKSNSKSISFPFFKFKNETSGRVVEIKGDKVLIDFSKGRDMGDTPNSGYYKVTDLIKKYADGGEIRRFDRHANMGGETRGQILDYTNYPIIYNDMDKYERINEALKKEGFRKSTFSNYLYGLFDGYDYSDTDTFKEQMAIIKKADPEFHKKISSIYEEIKSYPEVKYAEGGRVKKYNYVPNRMIQAIEVERNGKTTEIDGANILDGIYVKGKVKFADGGGLPKKATKKADDGGYFFPYYDDKSGKRVSIKAENYGEALKIGNEIFGLFSNDAYNYEDGEEITHIKQPIAPSFISEKASKGLPKENGEIIYKGSRYKQDKLAKGWVKYADGGMADGGEVKSMKEMMDSCYTYGGLDKGSYNYERYILPYKGRLGEKMFDKVYNQYSDLLKSDYEVEGNTYTDSEGLTYNTLKKKYAKGSTVDGGVGRFRKLSSRLGISKNKYEKGEYVDDNLLEKDGYETGYSNGLVTTFVNKENGNRIVVSFLPSYVDWKVGNSLAYLKVLMVSKDKNEIEDYLEGIDYGRKLVRSKEDYESALKSGHSVENKYAKGSTVKGIGSYKNHKIGDSVEVWKIGGKTKLGTIIGFEKDGTYIISYKDGSKSYTPKKYIANLSGEFPLMEEDSYANGGMMDYGSDLTDESTVRGNITNGEIHCDTLTEIIGCEPNYPCHNVGSLKLTKCFLRPYYKIG